MLPVCPGPRARMPGRLHKNILDTDRQVEDMAGSKAAGTRTRGPKLDSVKVQKARHSQNVPNDIIPSLVGLIHDTINVLHIL